MNPETTVLITSHDPALLGGLARVRPDVRAMAIGPDLAFEPPSGRLWCFVDWLLPETSGLEMVRRMRESRATRHSHITMVLEEGDAEERRRALKAGADDYLVGPLSPLKLADRLEFYEHAGPKPAAAGERLVQGELTLDLSAHQLRVRGRPVSLRPNEFRLLAHFMEHPNRVFSRTALIGRLGKEDEVVDERTVDVWIGRLRRALEHNGVALPLRTVRSLGYVFDSVET
jgi:two-component system phosphate regulon response regulator PhoB